MAPRQRRAPAKSGTRPGPAASPAVSSVCVSGLLIPYRHATSKECGWGRELWSQQCHSCDGPVRPGCGYVPVCCSHGSGRLCRPSLRAPKPLLPPEMTPRLLGRKMLHQTATGSQMQVQNCLAAALKILLCRAVHNF